MRLETGYRTALLAIASALALVSCDNTAPQSASQQTSPSEARQQQDSAPDTPPSQHNAAFAGLPSPYSEADYAAGRRTFKNCGSCHTLVEGGINLVGPNLYGIFGREAGSLEGFNYSSALSEAKFDWTPERLEQWLASPRDYLPGNKMSFAGVHRPGDRHAVIAYLMVETGYAPPAEEDAAEAVPSEPPGESNED